MEACRSNEESTQNNTIDVASLLTAYELIDDALFALIAEGNEAAWRIQITKTHTTLGVK